MTITVERLDPDSVFFFLSNILLRQSIAGKPAACRLAEPRLNGSVQAGVGRCSLERVIAITKVTGMTEMDRKNIEPATADGAQRARAGRWPRSALLGAGAFGLLAVGFAGGAAAWSAVRPHDVSFDTALVPTAIAALAEASSVGVDGQVAEIFGNKFVVTDGRARALVETGRAGAGESLVTVGETVTVQGRFDDGILHAAAIRHADQRIDELDPPPPPPGRGPGHHPRPDAAFEGQ